MSETADKLRELADLVSVNESSPEKIIADKEMRRMLRAIVEQAPFHVVEVIARATAVELRENALVIPGTHGRTPPASA